MRRQKNVSNERHCVESCDGLALPQTLYLGMDGTGDWLSYWPTLR
jgi:hypothetical protein